MYNVGDRVIITANNCMHGFLLGSTVVIESFQGKIGGRYSYKGYAVNDIHAETWYFSNEECRPIAMTNKHAANMLDAEY